MKGSEIPARESIEAIYPRDIFRAEAPSNSGGRAKVLRGIRVERTPGAKGPIRIVRATRYVGDVTETRGVVFVCPYMGYSYGLFSLDRGVHGPVVENADPFEQHPEEYDAFIGRVIAAAQELARDDAYDHGPSVAPGSPQPLRR
jgi:hypothetical protein